MKSTTAHTLNDTFNVEPVLRKALQDAEREHHELQQIFSLMGWQELPDELKMEIKGDVSAMVDELKGNYSTCDPFVQKRRKRVIYWIESYMEGICSLETAIQSVRIKKL